MKEKGENEEKNSQFSILVFIPALYYKIIEHFFVPE